LGVQHIIVLGHYGCKGVARAIQGSKERNSISKWIEPIVGFYNRERRYASSSTYCYVYISTLCNRREVVKFRDSRKPRRGLPNGITETPDASDPGFRAFVEENVKKTVKALKQDSILAKVRIQLKLP
jgi:carbonic anhydrase